MDVVVLLIYIEAAVVVGCDVAEHYSGIADAHFKSLFVNRYNHLEHRVATALVERGGHNRILGAEIVHYLE